MLLLLSWSAPASKQMCVWSLCCRLGLLSLCLIFFFAGGRRIHVRQEYMRIDTRRYGSRYKKTCNYWSVLWFVWNSNHAQRLCKTVYRKLWLHYITLVTQEDTNKCIYSNLNHYECKYKSSSNANTSLHMWLHKKTLVIQIQVQTIFAQPESNQSSQVDFTFRTYMPSNLGNMMSIQKRVRDKTIHQQLKGNLVVNIWQNFGTNQDFN